ncbi:Rpn family recombination-promoting nuclease/putative transposase [Thiothrix fructosivorans]|uniref:Rpn family recombination-promoting nuclease/putative transposase n=1 Tax=Thiothrix fructosivorans TaxID=111770 RepID=A0A8B0SIA0_9GAMM|nr:Rpn family recombination-promoting nuclease/putative transposase [Thiothrix fructosivorans]MBO0615006.1 Rpn family recombination-promoting nuclease/putative transposase [Thiothrix fructosivorans]QTX09808.1 Rpn family recombination-promoting nuclease/putative transposase [Thiothrix fructosivorans]
MRFLDVKTDFAFKKVFGSEQSKPILISFLNALLDYHDGDEITDLTIIDPYQAPKILGMKDTYVDVKAVCANGSTVIIEMQVLNVEGFEKRVLYNAAKAYSAQLGKGEKYHLLNPVIALTLTDFVMFPDQPDMFSHYRLIEKQTLAHYSGDLELVFIELPKFVKELDELTTISEKWVYFVKNAGKLDYVPDTLKIEPQILDAFGIANHAGLTEEELEAQEKRYDFLRVQRALQDGLKAAEEGLKEAEIRVAQAEQKTAEAEKQMAQAEQKTAEAEQKMLELQEQAIAAMHTKSLDIARQLLDVLDDATIALKTGLTVEEVGALR